MAAKKTPAKRKTPSSGEYAFAAGKTTLGEGFPGVTVREEGGFAELAIAETPYACIAQKGDDVLVSFLPAVTERGLLAKKKGYSPDPTRDGWVGILLSKDPRRWIEAGVGAHVGATIRAIRERAEARTVKSIASGGGPYVVIARSRVTRWGEDGEGTDYEAAQRGHDTASLLDRAWGQVLVLGTPDRLYFFPNERGGVFARVVSWDSDDESALAKLVASVKLSAWTPLEGELAVSEPLVAFDAAHDGVAIGGDLALPCDLPPGAYGLSTCTFSPDAGTELLLVRLVKKPRQR